MKQQVRYYKQPGRDIVNGVKRRAGLPGFTLVEIILVFF